jgi:hypothetical protein
MKLVTPNRKRHLANIAVTGESGQIVLGAIKARNETGLDRIDSTREDDRNRSGGGL